MQNLLPFLQKGVVRRSITRTIKESPVLRHIRLLQPETRLWFREEGTLPEFLVIGAQRSGSTFLHDYLSHNTSARSSPLQKEVHFFDNKYYKGIRWYSRFFESLEGEEETVKNFEASPYYLYHPAVPRRIRECMPDVKAVAVLRNPVDRALSSFRWTKQVDLETREAEEAFRYDAERLEWETDPEYLKQFDDPLHFDFDHAQRGYLRRSLYHVQLQRWLEHFDASQIRVVCSQQLFENTQTVIDELASFAGIRHDGPQKLEAINRNKSRKNVHVSEKARDIVRKHLEGVEDAVQSVLTEEMILGDSFSLS